MTETSGWTAGRSADLKQAMTALSNARFALAFSQSKIGELSARYHNYDEEVVFAAGQRIAAGNLSIAVRVEDEGARPIAVGSEHS
jgi:hypothetical protein